MAWLYWLLGSAFYFYQFVFRTIFATLGDEVTTSFQVSVADLSTFFSVGMLTYSLMQVPGGLLLDRYGPRKIMSIAMAALSAGILLVATTESFPLALLGRILMGIGSAFGFLGTSKIVVMWFPLPMMGFLLGFTVFLGSFGGAFSKDIFEALPQAWDWRETLMCMGAVGVLLAAGLWFLVRDRSHADENEKPVSVPLWGTLKYIFTNKQILLAGFFAFFGYLPVSIFGDSWGPLAFQKIFEADKEIADRTVTYFYIAFAGGAFFYSALAAWWKNAKAILIFEFILTLTFMYLLIMQTDIGKMTFFGVPGFLILCSLIAFNVGGVSLCFPIGCSHASKEISGTVVGVINMICMVSGSIFSKLVGNILHWAWDGVQTSEGFPVYSAQAFQLAFQPLLWTTALSLFLILFARERREVPQS